MWPCGGQHSGVDGVLLRLMVAIHGGGCELDGEAVIRREVEPVDGGGGDEGRFLFESGRVA